MTAARVFVGVCGGLFVVLGLAYWIAPASLAALGGVGGGPDALTDVRATYGGIGLGLGAFLLWSARGPERLAAALVVFGSVELAIGLGRLLGLAVDRAPTLFHVTGVVSELGLAAASFALYFRRRRGGSTPAS